MQLHLQVSPADFAANWNAAQALAGPQLALAANSPFLFGKQLWAETRCELFLQATDTRSPELQDPGRAAAGVLRRAVDHLDLRPLRGERPLLPGAAAGDHRRGPGRRAGRRARAPKLQELRLHNGTVYRWNRPVYDVADGQPHLRVENRVLPAGPTVVDVLANAAFYYGAIRMLAAEERPVSSKMTFSTAAMNFDAGARHGVDARFYWPGFGEITWDELTLRHLLPMAHEGLERWGVSAAARDRYLGIIEARCKTRRNGASWQVETVAALRARRARAGSPRCTRCSGTTGTTCTPTSRCTPGRSPAPEPAGAGSALRLNRPSGLGPVIASGFSCQRAADGGTAGNSDVAAASSRFGRRVGRRHTGAMPPANPTATGTIPVRGGGWPGPT